MTPSSQAALHRLQAHTQAGAGDFLFEVLDSGVEIAYPAQNIRFLHSFVQGPFARRARQSSQALLKACSNKQGNITRLLDLTAGWGMDSLSLAHQGKSVTLLEINPLVHAVVAWSIACLAQDAAGAPIAARLSLEQTDASAYLRSLPPEQGFDCIYLDPMFPEHKSGAKPAKGLQLLQAMTENTEIDSCFELALRRAAKRVVVKRPAKATRLDERKPDIVYREKTVRFDVYLTS